MDLDVDPLYSLPVKTIAVKVSHAGILTLPTICMYIYTYHANEIPNSKYSTR